MEYIIIEVTAKQVGFTYPVDNDRKLEVSTLAPDVLTTLPRTIQTTLSTIAHTTQQTPIPTYQTSKLPINDYLITTIRTSAVPDITTSVPTTGGNSNILLIGIVVAVIFLLMLIPSMLLLVRRRRVILAEKVKLPDKKTVDGEYYEIPDRVANEYEIARPLQNSAPLENYYEVPVMSKY